MAVGVLSDAAGRVLLSRRHVNAHQGGLWEFPGGKVERGETVPAALARELAEELSVQVHSATPLMQVSHDYGDKRVLLDVWQVQRFSGQPTGLEGQALRWVAPRQLAELEFPAANLAIVEVLQADAACLRPAVDASC